MNWDVVKETVRYGRSLEEKHNKKFRFTLTTNGVLLNDEVMEFANKEMANVVLSIDGRKEIHDYMRPTRNGKGSYDLLLPKFQEFAKKRAGKSYYVRGTYTHNNLDFSKDVLHMADLGFDQISIEPVVSLPDEPYAIKEEDIPFLNRQTRIVLENCGNIDAESIDEYIAVGGFQAMAKAFFDMSPQEAIDEVTKSGLRGRGGAGFPAGKKWSQVARQKEKVRYVVCNGDEGDPGAFMDGSVMEGDPYKMIEGMVIAAYAVGAENGYIYVRAEYPLSVKRLRMAIEQAEAYGLLGDNILGSGINFHLHINRGAGAFVCGEGSALTASIEGKRGMPRVKPPRTVEKGLWEKPTVLNNVETYANVPKIILQGADWFRTIGTEGSPGTKTFSLTGAIENTGLIEVPMGTSLRHIIYDIGGGLKSGAAFKGVQIGGPSGGCLIEDQIDRPLDFDSVKSLDAIMGSGGLVVMDENTCMVEVARFFMNFTQRESCGKCVPCREGTKRMLEILERIVDGKGEMSDLDELEELAHMVQSMALCGLGKSAPLPVISTLNRFRDEYVEHIRDKKCHAKVCTALRQFHINSEFCIGCGKCAKNCPAGAITGAIKHPHQIDNNLCIKCGACKDNCNFNAVYVEM